MSRILLSLAGLCPALAVAAEAQTAPSIEIYQAAQGDPALAMLAALFGGANGIFGPGADAQIDGMFLALNVAILAIASCWFFYNVASAIVGGSHDGEFLSRRYHSMWAPVRMVTGSALILPVWHGWNLAQLIMAYAASIGIGIANHTYTGASEGMPGGPRLVAPALPGLSAAAEALVDGHNCVIDHRLSQGRQLKTNAKDDPSLAVNWASRAGLSADGGAAIVQLGAIPAADGYTETDCGEVRIPFPKIPADTVAAALAVGARQAAAQALAGLDADIARLYQSQVDPDDPDALATLRASIDAGLPAVVAKANLKQATAMKSALAAAQNAADIKAERDKSMLGWLNAGGAYVQAAASQYAAAASMPAPAETKTPTKPTADRTFWQKTKDTFASAGDKLSSFGGCVTDPAKCMRDTLVKPFAEAGGLAGLLSIDGSNIIGSLQNLGGKLLFIAIVIFGGLLAIGAAVTAAFGGAGIMMPLTGFVFGVGIPLATLGLMLSIWPPLIIPIAWVFAVGAWLVIVLEALLAAPLWAMMHLSPEGEGFAGDKTSHGYVFLLNLLFRPALLVITVTFAGRLLSVLGGWGFSLVNGILGAMATADSNPLMGILLLLGGVFVIYKLGMQLIQFAASLLSVIPNQVFTWIGGQFGSDVGSQHQQVGGGEGFAAAGAVAGAGAGAAMMAARGGGKKKGGDAEPASAGAGGGEDIGSGTSHSRNSGPSMSAGGEPPSSEPARFFGAGADIEDAEYVVVADAGGADGGTGGGTPGNTGGA